MDQKWAAENLQIIRVLMERASVYRRAMAPVMLFLGTLGVIAAVVGLLVPQLVGWVVGWYWLGISLVGVTGAYLLMRRQAFRDREYFWSPPTKRVTKAVTPAMLAGSVVSVLVLLGSKEQQAEIWNLPPLWMILYGCALHAAGFFAARGIGLFGWSFVGAGCVTAGVFSLYFKATLPLVYAHAVMGFVFGGLHLAYGVYLLFTEQPTAAA